MRSILLICLSVLLLTTPATARELSGTCNISFVGESTLHDFDGTAACEPFVLTITETAGGEPLLGPVVLTVPVTGMATGIKRRDRTMWKMFASERYPHITGRLSAGPLAQRRRQLHALADGREALTLPLQIRDIEQPVRARVTRLIDTAESFQLDLAMTISLAEFQLEPPTILGFIRVADTVRVNVSVQLEPLQPLGTP